MSKEQGPQQTILTVDDSLPMLELFDLLLVSSGYSVLKAEGGEEAIEIAKKYSTQIRVILLDVMMPKIDGLQVAEILEETPGTSEIPILLISGNVRPLPKWAQRLHRETRPVDYLEKPFEPQMMIHKLANLIKISHPKSN